MIGDGSTRRVAGLLTALPGGGPIGEAWVLSDLDDHARQVAVGPLRGRTIGQLLMQSPEQLLGSWPSVPPISTAAELSVLLAAGVTGKTEAWVVLEAGQNPHLCGPEARYYRR
jgi:mannose-6-phosphate isomerase